MINFVNRMNEEELKKEVEKFKSVREKVLRLNEITKFTSITYGREYVNIYEKDTPIRIVSGTGGCLFCRFTAIRTQFLTLKVKNCNMIEYFSCYNCKDNPLCAYCLREKHKCNFRTKQKITFWLCTKTIFPKDIQRLITKLLFKN